MGGMWNVRYVDLSESFHGHCSQTSPSYFSCFSPFQDVDCAYMTKVDLEAKVSAIVEELTFLRYIFDAVRKGVIRDVASLLTPTPPTLFQNFSNVALK